jgi:hypothetical protein
MLFDGFDIFREERKPKGGKTMKKHKVHHKKMHKQRKSPYSMHFDRGDLTMPKPAFGHETLAGAGAYFHKKLHKVV